MTKILALDTSTDACSVAINVDGEIHEDFVVAPQDHTRRLLPMVDHLLSKSSLALRDVDAIAFTHGPGSFTGLRICVGIVQGLAFGANLPVIGVSTLEIMAMSAQRLLGLAAGTPILPVLDARMGEVYWALYRLVASESRPDCLLVDQVSPPEDLVSQFEQSNLYLVGGGCPVLDQDQMKHFGVSCQAQFYPHAYDLARLAPELLASGHTQSALDANPVYIRNEVSWEKRRRIRSQ
ncbi:tRNA (adenosine(37)-N6)-threonylcarbamoyltransferase complex dimerization subunit type 1 TsaB [Proteobacteria bacterium 005FR1]|nr:tRNA (adenosine(37)-N6)-threonylcarbamoyltransferase complex dimerization subunit type 1 TsaB [Proteobacteria bacterium 005FR1]